MNQINVKEYNWGIALIKAFMCFEVVLYHCWREEHYAWFLKPFDLFGVFAVPVFMLISFYLTYNHYLEKNFEYARKRFFRLLWPQIGWTVIYGLFLKLYGLIFKCDGIENWSDLLWQLLLGHSEKINPSMWYQFVLIVITAVFIFVFYFSSEKTSVFIISLISIFCIWLQYTGINYDYFSRFSFEVRYPLGRLTEMIPYAGIGIIFAYANKNINLKKKYWILLIPVLIGGISKLGLLLPNTQGFGYCGLTKISITSFIVLFVLMIPVEKIIINPIRKIVEILAKYALGVYCSHRLVAKYLFEILQEEGIETGTFLQSVWIYILSLMFCCLIAKVFGEYAKKLVV